MHLLKWEFMDEDDTFKIHLEQHTTVTDYAILSHRWGKPEDEVSFDDMIAGIHESKQGHEKLVGCCRQARKDGIRHVWVDTCCINKASSAELSEAITSMFAYYDQSRVCYAFLDDVIIESGSPNQSPPASFSQSVWFTRGWTLQELIAPQHVKFFDSRWSLIGCKTDDSLLPIIVSITNIDPIVLRVPATTKVISISKKMSWAAHRETTRREDMAYCLMGIFGVFMSPLYGEGAHAFIRLQEAIMKTSNDHTIFAWTSPPTKILSHGLESVSTMLALSPRQFRDSASFQPIPHNNNDDTSLGKYKLNYASTNSGLSIRLPLLMIDESNGLYLAFLACTEGKQSVPSAILLKTSKGTPAGHFWRTNCNLGPIERCEKPWLKSSGRDTVNRHHVYILPRFTSVSKDNIEPPWGGVDISNGLKTSEGTWFAKKTDSHLKGTVFESGLKHVPDPALSQLAFLSQAHQLIHLDQTNELVDQMNFRRFVSQSTLPRRNKIYFRRANDPQELIDKLVTCDDGVRGPGKDVRSCVIHGPPGIGKTQMAIEFGYYSLENRLFDTVFWIPSETYTSVLKAFQDFASKLELIEPASSAKQSADEVVKIVQLWFSSPIQDATFSKSGTQAKWLFIFDNMADSTLLDKFVPAIGPGHVLATTKRLTLSSGLNSKRLVIQPLTEAECLDMFHRLTGIKEDLPEIVTHLQGSPLAVAHLSSLLMSAKVSLSDFSALWKQHKMEETKGNVSNM